MLPTNFKSSISLHFNIHLHKTTIFLYYYLKFLKFFIYGFYKIFKLCF